MFKNLGKKLLILALVATVSFAMVACEEEEAADNTRLILSTTTSTVDTGLLDKAILPAFEAKYGYKVEVLSQGTGMAIATAKEGDADVILVHDRASEDAFVAEGFGIDRRDVMFNDFVIIGPDADPAGIKGLSIEEGFAKIAASGSEFISRGDDSGTHKAELRLWKAANIDPSGEAWYFEIGKGMGDTINMANEKMAYTMTDRGTYLAMMNDIEILIVLEGDEILLNKYGVIPVDPALHPHTNIEGAQAFAEFITSAEGQALIQGFKVNGEQLFFIEDQFLAKAS